MTVDIWISKPSTSRFSKIADWSKIFCNIQIFSLDLSYCSIYLIIFVVGSLSTERDKEPTTNETLKVLQKLDANSKRLADIEAT